MISTWKDVEASLQLSEIQLESLVAKDKSKGKFISAFRSVCNNAQAATSFTNVVPDTFGMASMLCGSLNILFTAMHTSSVFRKEVYDAVESIGFTINDNVAHIKLYHHDETLHQRLASVFVSLFEFLNHILT